MAYRPDGGTVLPAKGGLWECLSWGRGRGLWSFPPPPYTRTQPWWGAGLLRGAHSLSCLPVHQVFQALE